MIIQEKQVKCSKFKWPQEKLRKDLYRSSGLVLNKGAVLISRGTMMKHGTTLPPWHQSKRRGPNLPGTFICNACSTVGP